MVSAPVVRSTLPPTSSASGLMMQTLVWTLPAGSPCSIARTDTKRTAQAEVDAVVAGHADELRNAHRGHVPAGIASELTVEELRSVSGWELETVLRVAGRHQTLERRSAEHPDADAAVARDDQVGPLELTRKRAGERRSDAVARIVHHGHVGEPQWRVVVVCDAAVVVVDHDVADFRQVRGRDPAAQIARGSGTEHLTGTLDPASPSGIRGDADETSRHGVAVEHEPPSTLDDDRRPATPVAHEIDLKDTNLVLVNRLVASRDVDSLDGRGE